MYCTSPEENALLDKLLAHYPESDKLTLNLVAYMWINQREAYENAVAMLQVDYINPDDIPQVSPNDEKYENIYPKQRIIVPMANLNESLEE